MKPPEVTLADWRALVENELAGAPFERLVQITAEGLALQPLYAEAEVDPGLPGRAPFTRGASAEPRPFGICMRVDPADQRRPEALAEDLDGGADALWAELNDAAVSEAVRGKGVHLVQDVRGDDPASAADYEALAKKFDEQFGSATDEDGRADDPEDEADRAAPSWCGFDWIDAVARGTAPPLYADPKFLRSLAPIVDFEAGRNSGDDRWVRVSSRAFHDAGADAADELALTLSSAAAYLRAITGEGVAVDRAASVMWAQVAIGRDTLGELCKLRALRVVWHKLFAAAGATDTALSAIHAVCSARTQGQRDPWVNILRGTTQIFAAALGGAQLITPRPFDEALGVPSAHARRVARNAALVLREESHLGRVLDAGGGSYYLEARTDALAREAWSRFQAIERAGGISVMLRSGALRRRLDAAWAQREAAIARRKEPVLGVSEFARLQEKLPQLVPPPAPAAVAPALAAHRDGEAFEALRARVEAGPARDVALIALGPPAEHRGRTGYATALFATAGLAVRESAEPVAAEIACICGSDERYAAEAAGCARALRAAGCRRVVLAGKPGPLEAELRAAGVDSFVFVGCDAVATLVDLVAAPAAIGGAS
jgi:methylmalonyl-CoA mutase